jgi:hypothetical protein
MALQGSTVAPFDMPAKQLSEIILWQDPGHLVLITTMRQLSARRLSRNVILAGLPALANADRQLKIATS